MSAELVPAYAQPPAIKAWDAEQLLILKHQIAKGCSDAELELFAQVCAHKGLDPFMGEIVAISRWSKDGPVMSIQETVEGLRTIAERSGLYAGQDPPQWCGPDMVWRDVWLPPEPPAAARAAIWRKDWERPCVGIARYSSYVQLGKDKQPVGRWAAAPDYMLEKCAVARALKAAFPKEFARAGINVRDLSDAQRVVIEARAIGLDDDGRHALVAEVTNGRTDSTRDVTDEERLKVRQEIAGREAATDAAGVRKVHQAGPPGQDSVLYVDTATGQVVPSEEGRRRELLARIMRDVPTLTPDQRAELRQYRIDCHMDPDAKPSTYTLEQLELIDAWLDNTIGAPY